MVSFEDVAEAHERIRPFVHRTPILTSQTLNDRLGCEVFLKAESFQRTGSFKFRGATNAMAQLSPEIRERGVVTFSSGNHAQALALAGRIHATKVTVVMPYDAPAIKKAATEGYGADVVLFDKDETTREALGKRLEEENGWHLIPPFDHPHIVAGQGTVGKELAEDAPELDAFVGCVGGGGLLSGCSLSMRALSPSTKVFGVEPEAGDDVAQSLRAGKLVSIPVPDTIADGARTSSASELTFGLIQKNVDEVVTVSDQALLEVTHFLFHRMKIVVEPTGALALAAIWSGKIEAQGKRVGVTISGGNCDVTKLAKMWVDAGLDRLDETLELTGQ